MTHLNKLDDANVSGAPVNSDQASPPRIANGKVKYRRSSLRINITWTLAGSVTYALCQWGILIAIAQFGNPRLVGQFALALAITAPITMFASLNLRAVQATDARMEHHFRDYLTLRIISTAISLVAIVIVGYVAGFRASMLGVLVLVGIAKTFESISDVLHGLFQQRERMDYIALSKIIKGALSLITLALALMVTNSFIIAVGAFATTWLATLLLYDIPKGTSVLRNDGETDPWKTVWTDVSASKLGALARTTLPLGVSMLLISLTTNIPRYFLEHYIGTVELGIFAAIAYFRLIGGIIVNAVGQAVSPRLSRYYAHGDSRSYTILMAQIFFASSVLGIAGLATAALFGRSILDLIYGPEYAAYSSVFISIMLASAIFYSASAFTYGMNAARRFHIQLPLFGLVTLAILLSSALLVPPLGLHGAALSLAVGAGVQLIGSGVVVYRAIVSIR
jgi:O-antigen/teichoic acid export membrane protein